MIEVAIIKYNDKVVDRIICTKTTSVLRWFQNHFSNSMSFMLKRGYSYEMRYVSLCDDIGENKGGYFCQVYLDEYGENEFDYFVIHAEDIKNENDINKIILSNIN